MSKIALITGASSGIGYEFAKIFAREGYDLALVARREDRLNTLKQEITQQYKREVFNIVCDLTKTGAAKVVFDKFFEKYDRLDVLVNNAGVGHHGRLDQVSENDIVDMLQLNIAALTALTRSFLPGMITARQGFILNVASSAGFVPGPFMNVYYASKNYVLAFSEGLSEELAGTGVKVTVLCPGPVKTEFQSVAYHEDTADTLKRNIPTARETAEYGFKAFIRGQVVAVPDVKNALIPILIRFLPRWAVRRLVRHAQLKYIARDTSQ